MQQLDKKMLKKRYPRIQIGQYTYCPLQILGKTSKTIVYEGFHIITDQRVALKLIQQNFLKKSSQRKLISHQIQSMHELKGKPNIIQIIDVYETDQCLCIVLEACTETLEQMLDRHVLKQPFVKLVMQQILLGCETLHNAGYIHRDLKPSNILIKNIKDIRIADLGYITKANIKQQNGLTNTTQNVGSPSYMAPQSLMENKYSYKSDIWAIGMIYYQLLTGHLPWKAQTQKQLQAQLKSFNIQNYYPPNISEGSRQFLYRTLCNYKERAGKQDYTQLLEYLLPQYSLKIDLQNQKMTADTSFACSLSDISPIKIKHNIKPNWNTNKKQEQKQTAIRKNSTENLFKSPEKKSIQFTQNPRQNYTVTKKNIQSMTKIVVKDKHNSPVHSIKRGSSIKNKLSKWLSFNLN